jgi:hypothetical protein
VLGPQQQRLAAYVANADPEPLHGASNQWSQAETLLRRLSVQLSARAKEFGDPEKFSGNTATAAVTAFNNSAKKMNERADQMHDGSEAFRRAGNAVHNAKQASKGFEAHAGQQPPQQPADLSDVKAQKDWKTDSTTFWNHYDKSETAAGDVITALTQNHTEQAAVFAKIHGETPPPPPPPPPTGHNPVNTGTPTTPTHVPVGQPTNPHDAVWDPANHDHDDTPDDPNHPDPPPRDPGIPGRPTPPPVDPGVPQGPGGAQGSPFPAGSGVPTGGVGSVGSIGGGAGAAGGVGAVAGGALGGAAAAGLAGSMSGGLNGLMSAGGGVRGGLSSSGVRGIGATSRTGVGSVLGRGAGAGGRAGTGGMAGRNGGRGGSKGAGSRGSRGRAGARGAAGAGAGSGRNGKDKKRTGEERDLFDDGADWIDDEDAAPGVLD